MRRRLGTDELRLWRTVASTVKPRPGQRLPAEPALAKTGIVKTAAANTPATAAPAPPKPPPTRRPSEALHGIEPNRRRRIALGREPIGAVLDLHGFGQYQAHAAVERFVIRAHQEGHRAVLVITGQGRMGAGVLRRRLTEWLESPPLRTLVAGVSAAQRRHGGEGAFYVALKARA
jgi:DNA-nicking Smr family endonuclease